MRETGRTRHRAAPGNRRRAARRQLLLRVGVDVDDYGAAVGEQGRIHEFGEAGLVGVEVLHQGFLVISGNSLDLPAGGAVRVEHPHAHRVHLLGVVREPFHVDRKPGEGIDDRARARESADERVGEVVGHHILLHLEFGGGDDERAQVLSGNGASAVRCVQDHR